MDLIKFLQGNWKVVEQAPAVFVIFGLLLFGAGFAWARYLIADRLKLAEERVADYKDKLAGRSPLEASSFVKDLEARLRSLEPDLLPENVIDAVKKAAGTERWLNQHLPRSRKPR